MENALKGKSKMAHSSRPPQLFLEIITKKYLNAAFL